MIQHNRHNLKATAIDENQIGYKQWLFSLPYAKPALSALFICTAASVKGAAVPKAEKAVKQRILVQKLTSINGMRYPGQIIKSPFFRFIRRPVFRKEKTCHRQHHTAAGHPGNRLVQNQNGGYYRNHWSQINIYAGPHCTPHFHREIPGHKQRADAPNPKNKIFSRQTGSAKR